MLIDSLLLIYAKTVTTGNSGNGAVCHFRASEARNSCGDDSEHLQGFLFSKAVPIKEYEKKYLKLEESVGC